MQFSYHTHWRPYSGTIGFVIDKRLDPLIIDITIEAQATGEWHEKLEGH